jgi:catalase-peroxidase
MAMNDYETVALTAGGHTFGKMPTARATSPTSAPSPRPRRCRRWAGLAVDPQGGKGRDTITSGIEGAWTPNPIQWDMGYFDVLFGYEWELTKSPAGAWQWTPKDLKPEDMAPDAEDPSKKVPIIMTTADMAMRMDPATRRSRAISTPTPTSSRTPSRGPGSS